MFQIDWDFWQGQLVIAAIAVVVFTGVLAVFLLVTLIRKYRQVNRPDTPLPVKFGYYASIAYAIFPVDLLPDPLLIDDIGVLLGALLYVSRALKRVRPRPTTGPMTGHSPESGHAPTSGYPFVPERPPADPPPVAGMRQPPGQGPALPGGPHIEPPALPQPWDQHGKHVP